MQKSTPKEEPLVDGMMVIPTKSKDFLRAWLEVMKPLHKLTPTEMNFAAVMLKKREEIAAKVKDSAMVDKLLFDEDTRKILIEESGLSPSHVQIILKKMRNAGVLNGRRVNPTYIPIWKKGKPFKMLFVFKNED
jgi:hypothetical protein